MSKSSKNSGNAARDLGNAGTFAITKPEDLLNSKVVSAGSLKNIETKINDILGSVSLSIGLVNKCNRGLAWHTSNSFKILANDVPGMKSTVDEPWWLEYRGRLGQQGSSDDEVSAQSAYALSRVIKKEFPFIPDNIAEAIAYLVADKIMSELLGDKALGGYDGPTAWKDKGTWFGM